MATKPFVTVTLKLHDGTPMVIQDEVDANGKFIPRGTQAAAALARREQIYYAGSYNGADYEAIIPFHGIVSASIAKEQGEYTPAEDDFCQAVECITSPLCPEEESDGETTEP